MDLPEEMLQHLLAGALSPAPAHRRRVRPARPEAGSAQAITTPGGPTSG